MKRTSLILGGILAAILLVLLGFALRPVLQPPAKPVPQASVPTIPSTPTTLPSAMVQTTGCNPKSLTVLEPQPGARVTSPVTVRVRVENAAQPKCRWTVFEAVAGATELMDAQGKVVGTGNLMASDDWMTDGPVEFTGTITAAQAPVGSAKIVITEENPSGQRASQTVTIPVTF